MSCQSLTNHRRRELTKHDVIGKRGHLVATSPSEAARDSVVMQGY